MDQEWTWTGSGSGPELDNYDDAKDEHEMTILYYTPMEYVLTLS